MKNLKIKLNSESEAEEVKRLAVKAGYTLDALFSKWSAEFCYLVLCEDMSAGFANEIMADGDKPLSIGELRAMVNPMKEYLMPSRNYEYILTDAREALEPHAKDWVEIPELSQFAVLNGDDEVAFYDGNGLEKSHFISSAIIWQREQDEPFLTPECTLNDQYAEIEEVRQVEIHGTVKAEPDFNFGAAQAAGGVDATLSQRQSQYGRYEDVAHVTQQILSALRIGNYDKLPAPMKESLHMIASKMARIVNGDPEYLDNWHDIGGYAKLIEKLIKGE